MDKVEEVHHKELSCSAIDKHIENHDLLNLCKENSTQCFEDNSSKDLNNLVQSGKNLFVNNYLCFRLLYLYLKNELK